ncbi:hypothetical protein M422DRAFT_48719 [Sphaerobolus stellatus SS14]|uniref:Uncharacterized protein n=1 Tax=Sphaerobolus stellatus (strain SS14) TaxID=990650 RepID=A0A0C9VID0_SPHS4|nr:hypothetical protein M422DRAFT_48719 [Sphaerobolus stellatus SS14]
MALNSEQSLRKATESILGIITREREAQASYIKSLIRERDEAQSEARKATTEAYMYKQESERYKAEVDDLREQLVKTRARFNLTIVPVNDEKISLEGTSSTNTFKRLNVNSTPDISMKTSHQYYTDTPSNTIALLGSLSYSAANITPQKHLQEFVNNTESPDVDSSPLPRTPFQQRTLSQHTPLARTADVNYNYSPSETWCYCDGGEYGEVWEPYFTSCYSH